MLQDVTFFQDHSQCSLGGRWSEVWRVGGVDNRGKHGFLLVCIHSVTCYLLADSELKWDTEGFIPQFISLKSLSHTLPLMEKPGVNQPKSLLLKLA